MPGGNSDKGLGAEKNQVYLSLENANQYIDWQHGAIPGENFIHKGSLSSLLIRPGAIYGLNNKLNVYVNTTIGIRTMGWFGDNHSIHHRDENTNSGFNNAVGGLLGDSKIIFRYLYRNTGAGDGYRIIFGSGLTIPSKNMLTINPFKKTDNEYLPHRHFSMTNGTYNFISDVQLFYKRSSNPVFFGGIFILEKPLKENKYMFIPGTKIDLVLSAAYKRYDKLDGSIDLSVGMQYLSQSFWENEPSPNSKAVMITPSISYLFNVKGGALSIGLQVPFFIDGSFSGNEGNIDQDVKVLQMVLSYRSNPFSIKK